MLVRGLVSPLAIAGGVFLLGWWASRLPDVPARDARPGSGAPPATTPPTAGRGVESADSPAVSRPDAGPVEGVPRGGFFARVGAWRPGIDWTTAALAEGVVLLVWSVAGRVLGRRNLLPRGTNDPVQERGGEVVNLKKPDGTTLHVEVFGPPDALPVVLTHGWGADGTEWFYLKRDLAASYRLIVWDLPGLGLSDPPADNDYALDGLARDLRLVLGLAGGRPAVLVGHSIGGMTSLTFCKLFPADLGTRVSGLVLVHTTYTNPVHHKEPTWLLPRIQKPVFEPLCRAVIGLSPVVRLLTYLNGSAHRSNHKDLFAGTETRGQLDFVTRFMIQGVAGGARARDARHVPVRRDGRAPGYYTSRGQE